MKPRLVSCLIQLLGLWQVATPARAAVLFAVEEHGSRAQHINLVFLAEGYTAVEMPKFAADVTAAVNFLFGREPWVQYRSYCNVYRIEVVSNQSGCDNGATGGAGVLRDTYFNTGFTNSNIAQLLGIDYTGMNSALTLLNTYVPEHDIPVILVNDAKYGGAGGPITIVSTHSLGCAVVEHELGHSFALLEDEYDADYPIYTPAEAPNITAKTDRGSIRWNYWIENDTPLATPETAEYDAVVGLFEGAMYRASGWYRPHNNSVMRTLNRPCGAVNREQFVLRYYAHVRPLDAWTPATNNRKVTGPEQLSFTVTPKVPVGGEPLVTSWMVDGAEQYDVGGNDFSTLSDNLGNGVHTVTATVRDPTTFVRQDPDRLLEASVTWSLTLSNQPPNNLSDWRVAYGEDLANPAGDGLTNLMKYALGLPPTAHAQSAQLPAGSVTRDGSGNYLTLSVPRRARRQDVDSIVEVSDDLETWHGGWGDTVVLQDDESILVVRDATPMTAETRRFIRLKVVAYW
ncbi:MAG: M64 family metallopeptidase [Verrucomicrobiota bacterium]